MIDLNKIKLGHSKLTDSIYLYRHGKDLKLMLDKREAEKDVMVVLVEYMMHGSKNGSRKEVSFGDKTYIIEVKPKSLDI